VTETNVVGGAAVASLTVTKAAPPAPTGTYVSSGDGTGNLSINAVSAQDLDKYIIREGSTSGAVVYQSSFPGSVVATEGVTYYLSVTDLWGNTSASTLITPSMLP
jgi:hypothetical protein